MEPVLPEPCCYQPASSSAPCCPASPCCPAPPSPGPWYPGAPCCLPAPTCCAVQACPITPCGPPVNVCQDCQCNGPVGFRGPRGDTGAAGPKGFTGVRGPPGTSGSDVSSLLNQIFYGLGSGLMATLLTLTGLVKLPEIAVMTDAFQFTDETTVTILEDGVYQIFYTALVLLGNELSLSVNGATVPLLDSIVDVLPNLLSLDLAINKQIIMPLTAGSTVQMVMPNPLAIILSLLLSGSPSLMIVKISDTIPVL